MVEATANLELFLELLSTLFDWTFPWIWDTFPALYNVL